MFDNKSLDYYLDNLHKSIFSHIVKPKDWLTYIFILEGCEIEILEILDQMYYSIYIDKVGIVTWGIYYTYYNGIKYKSYCGHEKEHKKVIELLLPIKSKYPEINYV